ncbi:NADH dehydrogenase [ubiquinone] iron-sulfur protein 6, mitochondrial isoform X4 [Meles meles]|uniref:NADH dehydrogenase [ubiquinone] iron-sulfur protein 6, mitochondrial isoform X4 n=1 Tax=Meles meles TaxID=9662 RepID=UPI001E69C7E9|nr:NADH dehydrogenase [ubiquinone] iron-sulfur protein 6, mitochondrial isoform X4 [Meles meles]
MRKRVGAPGQGSALKMAVAVTFCRLLGRSGPAALSLPRGVRCFGARTSPTGEKITHTGQVYDDEDYRKVRFLGRQKEVNENFAIDLIAEQPDKETKTGTCGYCGLQFRQHHH